MNGRGGGSKSSDKLFAVLDCPESELSLEYSADIGGGCNSDDKIGAGDGSNSRNNPDITKLKFKKIKVFFLFW